MGPLGGNTSLIFIKWGEKKQSPFLQGLFVLSVYPHIFNAFGRADDYGLEGTPFVQNVHNSSETAPPLEPVFADLRLALGITIFSKSTTHGHFQSSHQTYSTWSTPPTLSELQSSKSWLFCLFISKIQPTNPASWKLK